MKQKLVNYLDPCLHDMFTVAFLNGVSHVNLTGLLASCGFFATVAVEFSDEPIFCVHNHCACDTSFDSDVLYTVIQK